MFLVIWLFLAIFLWLFAIFFPGYYISELVLSFLPYIILLSLIGLGLSIALLKNKKIGKYTKIMPLFILLFGLLFFLSSRQYNNFYNGVWFENIEIQSWSDLWEYNKDWLNILYSNILYLNTNYTGLQNWIKKRDPDMIFMVEFVDNIEDNLKEILKEKYPYSARTSWSQKYFGSVVFSKYPITNLTHQIDQWAWRYSYFYTNYNNKNYYIYLVHTSSPVTYENFIMRNQQFDILSEDFQLHQKDRTENDKVLVLGDFNVSPRSKYYKQLESKLIGMKNLTKNFTILFTWWIKYMPFLQVHIDHVFVNDSVLVWDVESVDTPGSDHNWFFIKDIR